MPEAAIMHEAMKRHRELVLWHTNLVRPGFRHRHQRTDDFAGDQQRTHGPYTG